MRIALLLTALACTFAATPALAQETRTTTTTTVTARTLKRPAAAVRIGDRVIFRLEAPRAGFSPRERAAQASRALEQVLTEREPTPVHIEPYGEVVIVYAGKTPILQLTQADAEIARDPTLEVHAAAVAAAIDAALRDERERKGLADQVFAVSLAIFAGLLSVLAMRKIGELSTRLRASLDANAGRIPDVHVGGVEVVHHTAVKGGLSGAITVGERLSQLAAAYLWLLITLSLFDATRGYTDALAGFVLDPAAVALRQLAAGLPLIALALVSAALTGLVLRVIRLFFGSIARGETHLGWLPQDVAGAASVLVRAAVVITAVVIVAPLVVPGRPVHVRAILGAFGALAFAAGAAPVLASALVGVIVVFTRRFPEGATIDVGGKRGRVREVTLLDARLETDDGAELRVPHLALLHQTARVETREAIEIAVDPRAPQLRVRELLAEAAAPHAVKVNVELVAIDAQGALHRIVLEQPVAGARSAVLAAAAEKLAANEIALGRAR